MTTLRKPRKGERPVVDFTSERIVLNAAQSRRFVEALRARPRAPSPALLEAARTYRTTVKSDLDQAVYTLTRPLPEKAHT